MTNEQELPQQLTDMLNILEGDEYRQFSKARFELLTKVSGIISKYGVGIPDSVGLRSTPKIQVGKDGSSYDIWLEERYKLQGDDQKVKQTILYVHPDDDTENYLMVTIQDTDLRDLDDEEIGDIQDINNLTTVLDFFYQKLGN